MLIHRRTVVPGGDVVQTSVINVSDEQRVFGVLADGLHRRDLPIGNAVCRGHRASFTFHCLTYRQRDTSTGLGQVFTQHQHRVVAFDFTQVRRINAAVFQHVEHQVQALLFSLIDAGIEVLGADQFTQRKVAFQAGTR
ncbi:hypothetical protein D3C79_671760 [compost metagenome]